jgi:predicted DNA-binding protein (MmcQ/YjbR family)
MCQWQSTQEKCRIETVPAQGTLLPKRKWVGLTDEESEEIQKLSTCYEQAIELTEAKLKEKNT